MVAPVCSAVALRPRCLEQFQHRAAVLFGLEEDEANLVGPAAAANWVQYQAETGGYDVEVVRDERTADDNAQRLTFRYEIA